MLKMIVPTSDSLDTCHPSITQRSLQHENARVQSKNHTKLDWRCERGNITVYIKPSYQTCSCFSLRHHRWYKWMDKVSTPAIESSSYQYQQLWQRWWYVLYLPAKQQLVVSFCFEKLTSYIISSSTYIYWMR